MLLIIYHSVFLKYWWRVVYFLLLEINICYRKETNLIHFVQFLGCAWQLLLLQYRYQHELSAMCIHVDQRVPFLCHIHTYHILSCSAWNSTFLSCARVRNSFLYVSNIEKFETVRHRKCISFYIKAFIYWARAPADCDNSSFAVVETICW